MAAGVIYSRLAAPVPQILVSATADLAAPPPLPARARSRAGIRFSEEYTPDPNHPLQIAFRIIRLFFLLGATRRGSYCRHAALLPWRITAARTRSRRSSSAHGCWLGRLWFGCCRCRVLDCADRVPFKLFNGVAGQPWTEEVRVAERGVRARAVVRQVFSALLPGLRPVPALPVDSSAVACGWLCAFRSVRAWNLSWYEKNVIAVSLNRRCFFLDGFHFLLFFLSLA
jgi:hypothetical protein